MLIMCSFWKKMLHQYHSKLWRIQINMQAKWDRYVVHRFGNMTRKSQEKLMNFVLDTSLSHVNRWNTLFAYSTHLVRILHMHFHKHTSPSTHICLCPFPGVFHCWQHHFTHSCGFPLMTEPGTYSDLNKAQYK